jgi:hypothetical protein
MAALMRHNGMPMIFQPAPSFDFFDPPQIEVEIEVASAYEHWRQWRYEHVSLDAQLWIHEMGAAMWAAKRPWWVSL